MAVENSVAGTILPNFGLLMESNLTITGEVYLRIVQNLLALPGQKVTDIVEVRSHSMAIAQCNDFLEKQNIQRLVETEDTAPFSNAASQFANKKCGGNCQHTSGRTIQSRNYSRRNRNKQGELHTIPSPRERSTRFERSQQGHHLFFRKSPTGLLVQCPRRTRHFSSKPDFAAIPPHGWKKMGVFFHCRSHVPFLPTL